MYDLTRVESSSVLPGQVAVFSTMVKQLHISASSANTFTQRSVNHNSQKWEHGID
jgi:hypothetical protein